MGRAGILFLGALAIGWMWLAFKTGFPDNALKLTLLCGVPQAYLAVKLFLECKCEKKDASQGVRPS